MIDNTTSPKQVQRQAEEIARFDEEMEKARNAAQNPPSEETAETPPADAPADDTTDTPSDDTVADVQTLDYEAEIAKWQQRYSTLTGKYNAEVPRLTSEIKELRATLGDLQSAMQEQSQKAAETPQPPLVTDDDIASFGPDLIDLIKRQATLVAKDTEQAYRKEIEALRADNQKLNEQLNGVTETQRYSSQQQVLNRLTELVPDWNDLNQNPSFLDWLGEVDPMSGQARQAYLDSALTDLDPHRLATVFNTYKQQAGLTEPPAPKAPKPEVQRQVTPGKSKATPTVPSRSSIETKMWTAPEIEEFYNDLRAGRYAGKEAEAVNIERQIDLAISEGRFRG
jgi:hypothetical protein